MKRLALKIVFAIFLFTSCSTDKNLDDLFDTNASFDSSTIAFIDRITDNSAEWSLCTADASGDDMQKITDKTVACRKPVRSHSGSQLLFLAQKFDYYNDENNTWHASSLYELYIINIDGTGLTLIDRIDSTEEGNFGDFDWSPDDRQIVYVRSYDNYWDKTCLILYDISDNFSTILQTGGNICNPKFSPDGKQIVYCVSTETSYHIYKMNVNGNNNQLIISNASYPKWSPKGDKIVYLASGKDRSSQISVANADGSNQKQLTSSVSPEWRDTGFPRDGNSDPQWTPDGKKIVYVSWENGRSEIFIMNADGSKQTRLTEAETRDDSPDVTPDGKYILFSSVRSGMIGGINPGICIMTLEGKSQKVLLKTGTYPVACR